MVIHLPTTEEREDILRRRYRVRRPEHRRAMYIGGGGVSIPGDAAAIAAASFAGNFASLFPGAYGVWQTDSGFTYGGTPLVTSGNTSTTVLTLTGSLATVPVPILAKATNTLAIGAGATFNIYYDDGTTPAMTGITPAVNTPVALTGAGAGLFLAWAAGTSVTNNSWKATCAALADQTANGNAHAQATASLQPVVTVGLNGKPGLLFDGVDDLLDAATLNLPAPSVTPWSAFLVFRLASFTAFANPRILSGISSSVDILFGNGSAGGSNIFASGFGPTSPKPSSNAIYYALDFSFTNSTADYLRVGNSAAVTGVSSGSSAPTGRRIGGGGATFSNMELLMIAYAPPQSATAWRAAVNSAAGYGVGAIEA